MSGFSPNTPADERREQLPNAPRVDGSHPDAPFASAPRAHGQREPGPERQAFESEGLSSSFPVDEKQRLSPFTPIFEALQLLVVLAAALFASGSAAIKALSAAASDPASALSIAAPYLAGGVAILALVVSFGFVSWRFCSFRFGRDEFTFEQGVLFRKQHHVAYDRVQSVNHRANLLQRLVGVCAVEVETAGGAGNSKIKVAYVSEDTAKRMRSEFAYRREGRSRTDAGVRIDERAVVRAEAPLRPGEREAPSFGEQEAQATFALSPKEHVLATVETTSKWFLLVAVPAGLIVGGAMLSVADDIGAGEAFSTAALLQIAITLGPLIGAFLQSTLTLFGYRSHRRGNRVEVEHGVLTKYYSGITIDRIQSIHVRQGILGRLLGYATVSAGRIMSAADTSKSSGSFERGAMRAEVILHPFMPIAQVEKLIAGLIPEMADREQGDPGRPLAPVALRRALIRRCVLLSPALWGLVALALGVALLSLLGFGAELVPFAPVIGAIVAVALVAEALLAYAAVRSARLSRIAFGRRWMRVETAGIGNETVWVPRQKLQSAEVVQNPLQKLAGVASVHALTAEGIAHTKFSLVDLDAPTAWRWFAWMHPRENERISS